MQMRLSVTTEPRDMLDTETRRTTTSVGSVGVAVNGPEDDLFDWDGVDWRAAEEGVRRLRQRIFTASTPSGLA